MKAIQWLASVGLAAGAMAGLAHCEDDAANSSDAQDATTADLPDGESATATELAPPAHGFQLTTPPITIPAGTESTWCYYFTIPAGPAAATTGGGDGSHGVKRWESLMSKGSHHLIVYFTATAKAPDGTVDQNCQGFGDGTVGNLPVWSYSAQEAHASNAMPDGVGMTVAADQHGYIQMHYLNPTLAPIDAHVTVNGETFEDGATYTRAAAFVTYRTEINIPAGIGQTASTEAACSVPEGTHFFALSTHSHKRSVATWVKDGDTTLMTSEDWEHPPGVRWDAPGYAFTNKLTYHCDYVNDRDTEVHQGPSAEKNEMCMAVGYFYPASKPVFCLNSMVIPL